MAKKKTDTLANAKAQLKKAKAQLEELKTSGAQNLESAATSAMQAGKNIDRIMARQLGLDGRAVPSGEQIGNVVMPPFTPGVGLVPPEAAGLIPKMTDDTAGVGGAAPTSPTTGTTNKVSAFDKLQQRLNDRGIGSLYEAVKGLIEEDLPDDEFTLQLRQTPAYKTRFAANDKRRAAGLRPLSEDAYIELEDSYQSLMRQYGLPDSYWTKDALGVQKGFESLIGGDVAAPELEERLQLAVDRVRNAPPTVVAAMRQYYPDITDGDIMAYTLDPKNTINRLRRQVQAAEIGGAASQAGFNVPGTERTGISGTRAEELAAAGVTGTAAKQGYQTIASYLPTATKLSQIYGQDGYTQAEAEQEVFGLAGMSTAMQKRRKLASQERAQFEQRTGAAASALEKGRSGAF